MIVLLSGGTGGAKLARGLLDELGPDRLAVIANTGDDIAAFGLHVSPDPDLVTYWLAGVIDEQRGYGIADETEHVFDRVVELGGASWFRLGDADLATCLLRTQMLHDGARLTEVARALAEAHGVPAAVLPMSDEPVQTYVRTEGEWRHFQEYLILQHSEPPLEGVEFRGAEQARMTAEVEVVLREAEPILIGPSNPIASIGPMLAVPGNARGARRCVRAGGRGQPAGRRPLAEGPDRGVHALGRPARRRRRRGGRLRRARAGPGRGPRHAHRARRRARGSCCTRPTR